MFSDLRNSVVFGRSQSLSNLPVHRKQLLNLKMNMKYLWHDTDNGKPLQS